MNVHNVTAEGLWGIFLVVLEFGVMGASLMAFTN